MKKLIIEHKIGFTGSDFEKFHFDRIILGSRNEIVPSTCDYLSVNIYISKNNNTEYYILNMKELFKNLLLCEQLFGDDFNNVKKIVKPLYNIFQNVIVHIESGVIYEILDIDVYLDITDKFLGELVLFKEEINLILPEVKFPNSPEYPLIIDRDSIKFEELISNTKKEKGYNGNFYFYCLLTCIDSNMYDSFYYILTNYDLRNYLTLNKCFLSGAVLNVTLNRLFIYCISKNRIVMLKILHELFPKFTFQLKNNFPFNFLFRSKLAVLWCFETFPDYYDTDIYREIINHPSSVDFSSLVKKLKKRKRWNNRKYGIYLEQTEIPNIMSRLPLDVTQIIIKYIS